MIADAARSALHLHGPQRDSRWTDHAISVISMVLGAVAIGRVLANLPPECDPGVYFPDWPCLFSYVLVGGSFFGLAFLPVGWLGL